MKKMFYTISNDEKHSKETKLLLENAEYENVTRR
jgi:hypothetical protein